MTFAPISMRGEALDALCDSIHVTASAVKRPFIPLAYNSNFVADHGAAGRLMEKLE